MIRNHICVLKECPVCRGFKELSSTSTVLQVWWFIANVELVLGVWLLVDTGAVYEIVLTHYFILKNLTNAYIYYSHHY